MYNVMPHAISGCEGLVIQGPGVQSPEFFTFKSAEKPWKCYVSWNSSQKRLTQNNSNCFFWWRGLKKNNGIFVHLVFKNFQKNTYYTQVLPKNSPTSEQFELTNCYEVISSANLHNFEKHPNYTDGCAKKGKKSQIQSQNTLQLRIFFQNT